MLEQDKKLQPIWSGPWMVTQMISSVLYRIASRKPSMVAHHDSLKLCSDRELPIWLLKYEIRNTKIRNTKYEIVYFKNMIKNKWQKMIIIRIK